MPSVQWFNIVVVGGGAAGFFSAIRCAGANPKATVVILEKSREVLQKVKVSGGGRCNVTHACFEPKELVENYPRGSKALLGPFHHFQPSDTIAWFEAHGVALTSEADGRMFPVSNRSQTIVDCLISAAQESGVKVSTGQDVTDIEPPGTSTTRWVVKTHAGQNFEAEKLMVATGSSPRIWN
ncbi:MAG: FAD-binding protein, partial [Saprospiraceae bacterium]